MQWTVLVYSIQTGKGEGTAYFIGVMLFKKVFADIRI